MSFRFLFYNNLKLIVCSAKFSIFFFHIININLKTFIFKIQINNIVFFFQVDIFKLYIIKLKNWINNKSTSGNLKHLNLNEINLFVFISFFITYIINNYFGPYFYFNR